MYNSIRLSEPKKIEDCINIPTIKCDIHQYRHGGIWTDSVIEDHRSYKTKCNDVNFIYNQEQDFGKIENILSIFSTIDELLTHCRLCSKLQKNKLVIIMTNIKW